MHYVTHIVSGDFQKNEKDALNFDTEFTKEDPVLTPESADKLSDINQEEFHGFSIVNKDFNPFRYTTQ